MNSETPAGGLPFETTRWSVVLAAGAGDGTESQRALAELCRLYWTPAYMWLRRRGLNRTDAQDLTQDFFAHLLANDGLARPRPEAGRFRSFLLRCLANFQADAHRRGQTQRRGGGVPPLALDALDEMEREFHSPAVPPAPDAAFDRRWAEVIVAQADATVRQHYAGPRAAALFEHLRPMVFGTREESNLAKAGAVLGLRDGALRTALSRLRGRFRAALRSEVAQTLADPKELRAELGHLINVLVQSGGAEETIAAPPS